MAKATLEFDLIEEREDLQSALDGGKWQSVAWALDQELRQRIKHQEHPEPITEAFQSIRNFLNSEMESEGLEFS